MKTLISQDKTKSLYSSEQHLVGNQQYNLGEVGLFKGRKFVLLPGHQYSDPFSRDGGQTVNVFKYRALILDRFCNFTGIVDGIRLSDLVRKTYGKCERDESGGLKPYPKVATKLSQKGYTIPESFGTTILNCGWDVRKQFSGKDSAGNTLYDGIIDKAQAFEVTDMELHYVSCFDEHTNHVEVDEDNYVKMKPKLVCIIERIDMPEGLDEIIKAATL